MAKQFTEPWKKRWETVRNLSGGGQGHTHVVRRKGDPSDDPVYVLKILTKQEDMERRGRMFREAAALRTLRHDGIPRWVESNTDEWENSAEGLYMVVEYIDGPTLEQFAKDSAPLPLSEALDCLLRLLDIISYSHQESIVHRDIKPDNVMLRSGDILQPALLDFGLSFNESADEAGPATPSEQQLGNRFLHLPELQTDSGNRRDPRSDLTQCCGLFFFLLTGKPPVVLIDQHNKKPHQRQNVQDMWARVPEDQRGFLFRLFDQAFEHSPDQRFQSARGLRNMLVHTGSPSAAAQAKGALAFRVDTLMAAIQGRLAGEPEYANRTRVLELLQETGKKIQATHQELAPLFRSQFGTIQSGHHAPTLDDLRFEDSIGFVHASSGQKRFMPRFFAFVTGTELVVKARDEEGAETDLFRAALEGPKDWDILQGDTREFFLRGIAKIFGVRFS